jgi:O-methyltransferase
MTITKRVFKSFSKLISKKDIYIIKSLSGKHKLNLLPFSFDYIRAATLELCYEEIMNKKIQGSIAELGVYRGDFAKLLNFLFSERKFYLFDTFNGFENSDVETDKRLGYSIGTQDFSNTNIEIVRSKMMHPQNCIFKQGFFPETAKNVEDVFCFVSIDADLFTPIYEGLHFFYPRLAPGGYIFVHDFNNDEYKGAKEAVLKFCAEQKTGFVPIADNWGTAIITK